MEESSFVLEIVSPTNHQRLMVEWVQVESPTGSFFVGPQHTPLVSLIKKRGQFSYKIAESSTPQVLIVNEGLFRVTQDNSAIVILIS
jgi:F0F1-type ATP synthase epsilon subunit